MSGCPGSNSPGATQASALVLFYADRNASSIVLLQVRTILAHIASLMPPRRRGVLPKRSPMRGIHTGIVQKELPEEAEAKPVTEKAQAYWLYP